MLRTVTASLAVDVQTPVTVALQVAVSHPQQLSEELAVSLDGHPVEPRELLSSEGNRLHVLRARSGRLQVDYRGQVAGRAQPTTSGEVELLRYLRPSRYCESDSLAPTARAEFAGLADADLLAAVSSWVGTHLAYVPGVSLPTDGALRTLLARQGVCRDFAHLVVAFLRALDVPARLVAVYAPGLDPMDFHAVAEAHVGGHWRVVDATALAPRSSLLRICTGQDASDTAFLSLHGGLAQLLSVHVSAVVDELPRDDVEQLISLG